tara:strand:- start:255 stop:887 length:633 start_codon:yes stop_codon:yes gene_type:complete
VAILGVPSTSIVDSTSVGRSLITASDAAAARVIMELSAVDDVTFNSVSAVDGLFSGNLNVEIGGTQRVYDLGTDGDANARYLEVSSDRITQRISGTASNTKWVIGWDDTKAGIEWAANQTSMMIESNYGQNIKVAQGYTSIGQQIFPRLNDSYANGISTNRWSEFNSVEGDFSGDVVMAANVDCTGLPTTDPVVAGRLWNHNDTVKISAG